MVDASVVVKWAIPEEDSPLAASLLGRRLVAPDLMLTECANILWKAVLRGGLDTGEAPGRLALLASVEVEILAYAALLPRALTRALTLRHPVYDCLYLEAAALTGFPLVTADRRLARLSGDGADVLLLSDLTLPPVA